MKTLTPNKRKGDGVVAEGVQTGVKRVCIDVNRCVSESETESDHEQSNYVAPSRPRNQTNQAKKKKKTLTREEKALAVADSIRGRMGFQQELLFRGKGKTCHECVNMCNANEKGVTKVDEVVREVPSDVEASNRVMGDDGASRLPMEDTASRRPLEDLASRRPMDDMASRRPMAEDTASRRPTDDEASRGPMDDTASRRPLEDTASRRPMDDTASSRRPLDGTAPEQSNERSHDEDWWKWEDPPHEHTVNMKPPFFASGQPVTGSQVHRRAWKKANKRRRQHLQMNQPSANYWTIHDGRYQEHVSFSHPSRDQYRGGMCPSNLALKHPAAPLLQQYATEGCPTNTGRRWTRREIEAAAEYGNHPMEDAATKQFYEEALEKEQRGLVEILDWEELKNLPDHLFPADMKLSPLSAVHHKSRMFRAILDLTWIRKDAEGDVPSVNANTTKSAPRGSMDQIGHALDRIIHAVATAPEGKKIYFAKWDVKDGFWQMVAESGAEWNFCYMITAPDGTRKIVKPSSLQMGWVDSPGFFGVASETARDVSQVYAQTPFGKLPSHKFEKYTETSADFLALPESSPDDVAFPFTLEVYVDDFIGAVAACSKRPLRHVGRATLHGIHDVFPPADKDEEDPNSLKKLKKGDGAWALDKDLLGFDFNGDDRTIIVGEEKRKALADTLKDWTRLAKARGKNSAARIPFKDFRKVIYQLRHAARSIPSGRGLLSNASTLASKEDLQFVFMRVGTPLFQELDGWRALLNTAMASPTKCTELITGHPDVIGIVDASKEGVGGVVVGENLAVVPTVFRLEWPEEVRALVISDSNPNGKITNSDLECAGGLLLWLVI